MTNERAIKLLNRISDSQFDGIHGDERREALEMAVRALEQNLVKESGGLVKDLVKDCISRQQAINAFEPEHDTDWYTPQIIEVLEALPPVQPTQTNADSTHENTLDCVSRQQAIDALAIGEELLKRVLDDVDVVGNEREKYEWGLGLIEAYIADMKDLPSAQPERDIPVKPIETTDKAWGIPKRQAVCPKCDYYLGHVAFLGDYKGKRVTYCETCGQAIDWEGWNFDE